VQRRSSASEELTDPRTGGVDLVQPHQEAGQGVRVRARVFP
jgi:hypothetical protein